MRRVPPTARLLNFYYLGMAPLIVRTSRVLLAPLFAVVFLLAGCFGSNLSGSSTCQDFMNAPADQQDQIVSSLAAKYQKPDFATPLGRPEIPYYCSTHPDTTLDQFFAGASD